MPTHPKPSASSPGSAASFSCRFRGDSMTRLRHRPRITAWLPLALLFPLALTLAAARRGAGPQGDAGTADLERTALSGSRGGRLLRAAVIGPRTFNPLLAIDGGSMNVIAPLFDGLVVRD